MKGKEICLLVGLFLLPTLALASPIENIRVIEPLPEVIIAGQTYPIEILFDNSADSYVPLIVNLVITEYSGLPNLAVWYEDFSMSSSINGFQLDCIEDLINNGTFNCYNGTEEYWIPPKKVDNRLLINIKSKPNLIPSNYTFTLSLLTEEEVVIVYLRLPRTLIRPTQTYNIFLSLTYPDGTPIMGLAQDDFELFYDGDPLNKATIKNFNEKEEGEYHFVIEAPEEGDHTLTIVITFDSYTGTAEKTITVKKGKLEQSSSHASISVKPSSTTDTSSTFGVADLITGMLTAIGRLIKLFYRI